MDTLPQDFRYARRMLRKHLGMTIVIVLSLGIGMGATSAIFSVVDALLPRPGPVAGRSLWHAAVTIAEGSDRGKAFSLHREAHHLCFIANSVNFRVEVAPET